MVFSGDAQAITVNAKFLKKSKILLQAKLTLKNYTPSKLLMQSLTK
jgi:hypothetical protein